jgi:hypothetical protein
MGPQIGGFKYRLAAVFCCHLTMRVLSVHVKWT